MVRVCRLLLRKLVLTQAIQMRQSDQEWVNDQVMKELMASQYEDGLVEPPRPSIHQIKLWKSSGTLQANASPTQGSAAASARYAAWPTLSTQQLARHYRDQYLSQLSLGQIMRHLLRRLLTLQLLSKKPTILEEKLLDARFPETLHSSKDTSNNKTP